MDKLKQTITVLFRRKGKDSITEKEFVFSASMDMRWFTPRAAQRLLDIALQTNLITRRDDELYPNFDLNAIEVPLEFKPTEDILRIPEGDLLSRILSKLSESRLDRKELVAKINAFQNRFEVEPEVAALILGNDLGVNIKEFIPLVEEKVKKSI